MVMAWILLLGLLGYIYKRKIIEAIEGLTGKVAKLDFQTDNRTIGQCTRLAMFINLDKYMVSQVMVDSIVRRLEYEALLTVCFSYGKYGHVKDLCPPVVANLTQERHVDMMVVSLGDTIGGAKGRKGSKYRSCMDVSGEEIVAWSKGFSG
ncbi:hypothetical protein J1N35_023464 [Gossypium stocksii]|uniref:Uncharacterized protein n=1 Tax=Gossypium stocksii TaxID=47602 RepID=A0A9D3VIV7_9ROSI|nr:hypothetical protein J1N35_023464 [Gossypium stocksii]